MKLEAKQFSHGQDSSNAEASTLGFPPGMWPRQIQIDGIVFTMENINANRAEYVARVVIWND